MADAIVRTVNVELRTCKLTKFLLKQIQVIEFPSVRKYLKGGTECQAPDQMPGEANCPVVGWVHGGVIESDEEYAKWLIIRVAPGDYKRYRTSMKECWELYQQIYVV